MSLSGNRRDPVEDMLAALRGEDPSYTDTELDAGFADLLAEVEQLTPQRASELDRLASEAEFGSYAYARGLGFLARSDFDGAAHWLSIAADHGVTTAQEHLRETPKLSSTPKSLTRPSASPARPVKTGGPSTKRYGKRSARMPAHPSTLSHAAIAGRRNLAAAGAGALLAAVLGTVVTLGATSDNSSNSPSDRVGVGISAVPASPPDPLPYAVPPPPPSSAAFTTARTTKDASVYVGKGRIIGQIPQGTLVPVDRLSGAYAHIAGSDDDWVHIDALEFPRGKPPTRAPVL